MPARGMLKILYRLGQDNILRLTDRNSLRGITSTWIHGTLWYISYFILILVDQILEHYDKDGMLGLIT